MKGRWSPADLDFASRHVGLQVSLARKVVQSVKVKRPAAEDVPVLTDLARATVNHPLFMAHL